MSGCQEWVFGDINSVGLPCVKITSLGEIAIKDNPTSQSVKRLGSVPKYMQTIVKSRVCFFNRFHMNVDKGMCETIQYSERNTGPTNEGMLTICVNESVNIRFTNTLLSYSVLWVKVFAGGCCFFFGVKGKRTSMLATKGYGIEKWQ